MLVNSAVAIQYGRRRAPDHNPLGSAGLGAVLLETALHFAGDARGLWVADNAGASPRRPTLPVSTSSRWKNRRAAQGDPGLDDYPSPPPRRKALVNDLDARGRAERRLLGQPLLPRASRSTAAAPTAQQPGAGADPGREAGRLLDPDLPHASSSGRSRSPWSSRGAASRSPPAAPGLLDPRNRTTPHPGERDRRAGPGRVGEDPDHAAQRRRRDGGVGPGHALLGLSGALRSTTAARSYPTCPAGRKAVPLPRTTTSRWSRRSAAARSSARRWTSRAAGSPSAAPSRSTSASTRRATRPPTRRCPSRAAPERRQLVHQRPGHLPAHRGDVTVNIDHRTSGTSRSPVPAGHQSAGLACNNKTPGPGSGLHTTYDDVTEPDGPEASTISSARTRWATAAEDHQRRQQDRAPWWTGRCT